MLHTDQMGRKIELNAIPQKIISTVPSQTELLFTLGLNEEVVGITKFCVHPQQWFNQKIRVGGTKQLNMEKIRQLAPDLIIANKEENVQQQIEELSNEFPVWVSDVNSLTEALDMIKSIGRMVGKESKSFKLVEEIETRFASIQLNESLLNAAYLIWKEPYMAVGGNTFIDDMMRHAGFINFFQDKMRYPETDLSELKDPGCDVLLLSSEPYPFNQTHVSELQAIFPGTKIILVDGEMFSWYGSRLLQAPLYFNQLKQQILSLRHAAGK